MSVDIEDLIQVSRKTESSRTQTTLRYGGTSVSVSTANSIHAGPSVKLEVEVVCVTRHDHLCGRASEIVAMLGGNLKSGVRIANVCSIAAHGKPNPDAIRALLGLKRTSKLLSL